MEGGSITVAWGDYIFDVAIAKGYVGAAYGTDNILGRWLNYADSGHGRNRLLRIVTIETAGSRYFSECLPIWRTRTSSRLRPLGRNGYIRGLRLG